MPRQLAIVPCLTVVLSLPPIPGIACRLPLPPAFYVSAGDLNSGPRASLGIILSSDPSSWVPNSFIFLKWHFNSETFFSLKYNYDDFLLNHKSM